MLKDLFPNARPWQRGGLRLLALLAAIVLLSLAIAAVEAAEWFAATCYATVWAMLLIIAFTRAQPGADDMPADDQRGRPAKERP